MKKKLTDAEIKARAELASFNRKCAGYKRTLKGLCKDQGLRGMELKLEFLKNNPTTKLPKEWLDYEQTLAIFQAAVDEYKESLKKKK